MARRVTRAAWRAQLASGRGWGGGGNSTEALPPGCQYVAGCGRRLVNAARDRPCDADRGCRAERNDIGRGLEPAGGDRKDDVAVDRRVDGENRPRKTVVSHHRQAL